MIFRPNQAENFSYKPETDWKLIDNLINCFTVPIAELFGYPDMFVRAGETINLTCVISRSPEAPHFVFWYHNDRMINYDPTLTRRGEISLGKHPEKQGDSVVARLVIRGARLADSGNYTCAPANTGPTSIYVHVLQGE